MELRQRRRQGSNRYLSTAIYSVFRRLAGGVIGIRIDLVAYALLMAATTRGSRTRATVRRDHGRGHLACLRRPGMDA